MGKDKGKQKKKSRKIHREKRKKITERRILRNTVRSRQARKLACAALR